MASSVDSLLDRAEKLFPDKMVGFAEEVREAGGEAPSVRLVYLRTLLPVANEIPKPSAPSKDGRMSQAKRALGNVRYGKGDNRGALHFYNLAVAFAQPDSEELKLAYGNRSAALLALNRREPCLKDIDRALAMGCDDNLRGKLEKRKAAAAALTHQQDKEDEEDETVPFGRPRETLPDIPCASAAVEVRHSPEWGRYVAAVRDVAVGETLVYEKPYMSILLKTHRERCCYECCRVADAMLPCEGCSRAMFCDQECRTRSMERGHRYECPLMEILETMDFTKIELLGFRIALRARCERSSWDDLRKTAESCESIRDPLALGRVVADGRQVYDSEYYESVHTLKTNWEKRTGFNLTNKCFSAAAMLYLLKTRTELFADVQKEEDENLASDFWFFGGLIVRHIMIVASNGHSIEELEEDLSHNFLQSEQICSCLYPFLSLVNHSCAPNVTRETKGTTTALLALRPLKKGQQVFDNYGQHHAMQPLPVRQKRLEFQYLFKCECEACVDRWPMYISLPPARIDSALGRKIKNIIEPRLIDKLQKGNKSFALSILTKLYKNVTILESFAPCKELADHQETIKQCWALFGNVKYLDV